MSRYRTIALLLALLAGCEHGPGAPLLVSDLDIRAPRPGTGMGAAYLALSNNLDEPLTITRVSSPQFGVVELHETVTEGDVSRMRPLPGIEIEPGATVRLAPGGKHLMLMQPHGETQRISLSFWSDETLLVSVTATAAGD